MFRKLLKPFAWLVILTLLLASQACSISRRPAATVTQPSVNGLAATPSSTPSLVPTVPPTTPVPTPTEQVTPTETTPVVTVMAVKGNLAIRKGPDVVFDAVDTLHDGESAQAVARSILDGWVEIPIPSQPGKMGWVSLNTAYSVVSGDVLDLPMIRIVEWPTGAYLRNCTTHQMIVRPLDTLLPPVSASPDNRVWFPPGLYTIYDQEVEGQPEVLWVQLRPQYSIDIKKDGNGVKSSCP
jgi:hypothetical protein